MAGSANIYVSIDGNLIEIVRRLGGTQHVRSASVFGLLRSGVLRGRITWLESARAIAQLSRGKWTFISVGPSELSAVLLSTDRGRRNADLNSLLRDFSTSEPRGAVSVVIQALDQIAHQPSSRRTRAIAERLFRALPAIPRAVRAGLVPPNKGRWYSAVLRAWLKNGTIG